MRWLFALTLLFAAPVVAQTPGENRFLLERIDERTTDLQRRVNNLEAYGIYVLIGTGVLSGTVSAIVSMLIGKRNGKRSGLN